jgi:hypothetical protein
MAILYHEVPNLSITIRNFFIAVYAGRRDDTRRTYAHSHPDMRLYPDGKGSESIKVPKHLVRPGRW